MAEVRLALPVRLVLSAALGAGSLAVPAGGAALALAPPATAAQDAPRSARADDLARARERVLVLSGGGTARARCRLVGESWEVEVSGGVQRIPRAQVERATPVSDLLREAEKRSARLKPTDADGRAAHAAWLLTAGLVPECVGQLDRVLTLAPAHHGARELLESPRLAVALPPLAREHLTPEEGLLSYARLAGMLGPAGRQLAARELAAHPPANVDVEAVLTGALVDASVPTRTFAARALGQAFPGRAVDPLYRRAILDTQEVVRTEAALALAEVGHEAIVIPAIDALESENAAVRTHAADALALMGFPHAVPALVSALAAPAIGGGGAVSSRGHITVTNELAYVQDVDVEIAAGASIADPIVGSIAEGVVLDARVLGVQMYTVQVQKVHIRRALEQLTGEKPGRSAKAWDQWWQEHGDAFLERLRPH